MALELDKMTRLPGDEAFRRESIKGTQWEVDLCRRTLLHAPQIHPRSYRRGYRGHRHSL